MDARSLDCGSYEFRIEREAWRKRNGDKRSPGQISRSIAVKWKATPKQRTWNPKVNPHNPAKTVVTSAAMGLHSDVD